MKRISPPSIESAASIEDLPAASITARFEQIVALYPQQAAIGSGSWQPTYAQLNAAVDALADEVRLRCAPGSRVALLHRLDGFLIGSVLGVLKAGRVVAVLNSDDPVARLRQNLEAIEPALIVGEPGTVELAAQITEPSVPVVLFSGTLPFSAVRDAAATNSIASRSPSAKGEGKNIDDVAFLIQTSGSTGRPKWVTRSQRSIVAQSASHNAAMQIQPGDRILLLAAPGGNHTLANMFCALLCGAAICPFPVAQKGIIGLGDWLRRHDITVYVSAASAFRHLLKTLRPEERFPQIRIIRLASEAILAADLRAGAEHFRDDSICYCSYNCSEAGNITQLRVKMQEAHNAPRLPLGDPALQTEILLVDETNRPVASGDVGEIVVNSPFLSAGYWRDEKLTAERFKTGAEGKRFYYTGDLARREPDGQLYYFGRRDDMVKIRGSRVLLKEIEQHLRAQPDVQEAVVLARTLADGSPRLVAFVVATDVETSDAGALRNALASQLPDHSLPAEFVFLRRIPQNANGKIDRDALLKLAESQAAAAGAIQPRPGEETSTAAVLSEIWIGIFGVSADANSGFFQAGGDSLTAGVVAARIHAALDVELDMLDFIQHPRFSDLVRRIDALRSSERGSDFSGGNPEQGGAHRLPPLERCPPQPFYPLSFEQAAIWRHCRTSAEADRNYTTSRSYGLEGALNVEALRAAIDFITNRNEILRTTFPLVDRNPVQKVHPPAPVDLPLFDFSNFPDARERGVAKLREEALRRLDLKRGPLLRYALVRIAPEEHWLLRVSHQILADGWSWRVFMQEVEAAYGHLCERSPLSLEARFSPSGLDYRDYAVWQRRVLAPGAGVRKQVAAWWKQLLADKPTRMDLSLGPSVAERVFRARPKPSEGRLWSALDPAIKARLGQCERDASTTHFVIGLGAFALHLAAFTARRKVIIGTHVSNRNDVALHDMQGYLSRLLPIYLEIPSTGTFLDWLTVVRIEVAKAQAHAQLPREELWEDLRALGQKPPDIAVIFGGTSVSIPPRFAGLALKAHDHRFKGLAMEAEGSEERAATMPWGLTLVLDATNTARPCEVTFDARRYHRPKVQAFLERYLQLLDRLSSAPDQPLAALIAGVP